MAALVILSRWLHVVTACLAVGGVFFIRFILPRGITLLAPEEQKQVLLKTRRAFKIVIHAALVLFVITGAYNTTVAWPTYALAPALLQSLWGTHILLALAVFSISLYVLAGSEPRRRHGTLMAVNFVLLLLAVSAASTLKWAREKTVQNHFQTTSTADKR
jgi:uncharacterized membrane protein